MVDGYTVSDERTAEGAAQHIDTTASIPADTNIDIIVNQTTDGGLSLSETVTLSDGANNIDLSNFDDTSGSYYIRIEFTGLSPDLGIGGVTLYVEADAGAERKTITWSTNEDWTNSQTAEGVVYEDTANTDHTNADTVKRGYKIANPQPGSPFIYWPMHENSSSTAYDFGTSGNNGTVESSVTQGNSGLFNTTSYKFNSTSYVKVGGFIPSSAVAYWTFNNEDTSGGEAIDIWGNNNGTISGATTGVAGINPNNNGEAYDFASDGDTLDIPDIFSGLSSVTLTFWIDFGDSTPGSFDRFMSCSNNNFRPDADRFYVNGSNFTYSGSFSTNTPTMITFVYDSSGIGNNNTAAVYKNDSNNLAAGSPSTSSISTGSKVFMGGGNTVNGVVDDVKVYSKALTTTEISNLYSTGSI